MDPRVLRSLCLSLALLIITILFLYPVNHKRLIKPWRQTKHPLSVVQSSALAKPPSANYMDEVTTFFSNDHPPAAQWTSSKKQPLKIAIIESMGWHDEVYAALVHAFGSQPDVDLSLFFANPRWGMPDLLKTFNLTTPLPDYVYHGIDALDVAEPDIIVLTTCEYDVNNIHKRLDALFERKRTYLICTAHYTNEWGSEHDWLETYLPKWMDAGMMTIPTLSPHVQKGFYEPGFGFSGWDGLSKPSASAQVDQENRDGSTGNSTIQWPPIELFVPVFPVPDLQSEESGPENGEEADKEEVAFAMQGGINLGRDYSRIIGLVDDFLHSNATSPSVDLTLHIIGSTTGPESDISVPDSAADHIFFDKDLDYLDYYAYLSRKTALLPAFALKDFLSVKASSSIPASVIAGIPLVATREILGAYAYLEEGDVYVQEKGETESDVFERVVKGSMDGRMGKSERVRGMRNRLIEGNVRIVEGWIEEARRKIGR